VRFISGEAHFQVAKDPERPFVVAVAGVEVRAVGTAFAVQLGRKEVAVLVTEGRVAVDQLRSAPNGDDWRPESAPKGLVTPHTVAVVNSGFRAVVEVAARPTSLPRVSPVSEEEINRQLAWRIPEVEFSHTPLAEVVSIINRHNRVRLVIASPELNRIKLSGFLRADNADGLVRLLENNFAVKVERRGETEIWLRKAALGGP
jgi:transmembrane sensor